MMTGKKHNQNFEVMTKKTITKWESKEPLTANFKSQIGKCLSIFSPQVMVDIGLFEGLM